MYNFKIGDLVAKKHPSKGTTIKTGIVISECETSIDVKWFSYNKKFFMEKTHDIFQELNKTSGETTKRYLRSYWG